MSQDSRPTRRRLPVAIAAVVALVLLGAGCAHDNTPQSYQTTTPGNPVPVDQYNFVQGCTGGSTGTTIASTDLCQCMIDWIMVNVPASDSDRKERTNPDGSRTFSDDDPTFISINNDLAEHPDNLPDDIKTGLAGACASKGFTTSTTAGSSGTAPLAPTSTQG